MNKITIKTCVGIIHIGQREQSGLQITEKLKQHDFKIVQWDVVHADAKLEGIDDVDVIIVNIGIAHFEFDDFLTTLFEKNIKIVINEATLTNELSGLKRQSWERHLLNKIDSSFSVLPENKEKKTKCLNLKNFGIDRVWILAASIGGPDAIRKFLTDFETNKNTLFIIIQHLDKEFVPMMVKQLDLVSEIDVIIPLSGMVVAANKCIIYPTDEHLYFNQKGVIELQAMNEEFKFTPCIDESCKRLNDNIKDLNLAIFSGMSSDGIEAAKIVKEKGNKVITQTESSCVLSSIIAGVKQSVEIDFDGTPSEMAEYIMNN